MVASVTKRGQKLSTTERVYLTSRQLQPPHRQSRSAKLRGDLDGVYDDVGCTRQQPWAARSDSREGLMISNLPARHARFESS